MIDALQVTQFVGELDEEELITVLEDFVESNPTEEEAQQVVVACQEGMAIVGDLFQKGEYFVGDLIFAGELLSEAMKILKPAIGQGTTVEIGSIVLGTVHGDLHDIGKNIFKNMCEAAGFQVFDIGIDQSPESFIEKIKEIKPNIVGMSGMLTLALESMKETILQLEEAGLRDSVKVIIGGNPVTKDVCEYVGADAFTVNAAEGVKICQDWVK